MVVVIVLYVPVVIAHTWMGIHACIVGVIGVVVIKTTVNMLVMIWARCSIRCSSIVRHRSER